jgi:dipeptidyl aminopeptidase/acylaminoacyl peptidase
MKKIIIKSLDGLRIYGHISFPNHFKKKKKYPAILFISGGIHGSVYDKEGKKYDVLHLSIVKYFNMRGYVTFILDKRGSKGYGKKYLKYLDCFGDETLDIIAGGKYLQSLQFIDKRKIVLHGTSRGAPLAALVLEQSDIFAAGILASGFYDLYEQYKYEEKYRKDIFPTKKALSGKNINQVLYKKRSPIHFVNKINCPILIVHGMDDLISPIKFSKEFYNRLKKNKKDVKFIKYKNFAHLKEFSYPTHPTGKRYWKDVIQFLDKKIN